MASDIEWTNELLYTAEYKSYEDLLNWIYDLGIKITTVYVLSDVNLERDPNEIDNIYSLLVTSFTIPEKFIEAKTSFYLVSEKLPSLHYPLYPILL